MAKDHTTCASKRRYWSEVDALIVANKRTSKGSGKLRVYRCPTCKGWHLSGKKYREQLHASRPA